MPQCQNTSEDEYYLFYKNIPHKAAIQKVVPASTLDRKSYAETLKAILMSGASVTYDVLWWEGLLIELK